MEVGLLLQHSLDTGIAVNAKVEVIVKKWSCERQGW